MFFDKKVILPTNFFSAKKAPKSCFSTKKSLLRRLYFKQIFFSRSWVNFTARDTVLRFKKCLSRKSIFLWRKWLEKLPNHVFRRKNHFSDVFISNNFFFRGPEWILRQGTQYYVLKNVYRENRFFCEENSLKSSQITFFDEKITFPTFLFQAIFFFVVLSEFYAKGHSIAF